MILNLPLMRRQGALIVFLTLSGYLRASGIFFVPIKVIKGFLAGLPRKAQGPQGLLSVKLNPLCSAGSLMHAMYELQPLSFPFQPREQLLWHNEEHWQEALGRAFYLLDQGQSQSLGMPKALGFCQGACQEYIYQYWYPLYPAKIKFKSSHDWATFPLLFRVVYDLVIFWYHLDPFEGSYQENEGLWFDKYLYPSLSGEFRKSLVK